MDAGYAGRKQQPYLGGDHRAPVVAMRKVAMIIERSGEQLVETPRGFNGPERSCGLAGEKAGKRGDDEIERVAGLPAGPRPMKISTMSTL